MSFTLADLRPKEIKLKLRGIEVTSRPLRLKHALILAKVGSILEKASEASIDDITQAQDDIDKVLAELIPELEGIELSMDDTMSIITQLMDNIHPDDNKELDKNNVSFDTDPKVQTTGL